MVKFTKVNVPTPDPAFIKEQKAQAEKQFSDNYEFKQPSSVRSPVSKWEEEHIRREDSYYPVSPREKALVTGSPSNFGHKGAQVQGKLRGSGSQNAHRIGNRKK